MSEYVSLHQQLLVVFLLSNVHLPSSPFRHARSQLLIMCVYLCACVFVSLTILEAHPQLFVVFFLHVVDDLALVLEGIGLLDAGHEMSLDHRAGRAVEQVTIWKILTCR